MAYELNEGQGSLFRNDKKTAEKQPDYRGKVKIGGVVYELAGWIRQNDKGQFLSLSAQVKQERDVAPGQAQPVKSDLPF